jgi:hypothetical protein
VSKVHTQPIKRPNVGFNKRAKEQPKAPLVWHTGLCPVHHRTMSGALEDSSSNLPPSGNSRGDSTIIHRTVRCTPDMSGAPTKSGLRNSPASGKHSGCSAIIHRTCPVQLRSNGYFAPTATCRAFNVRAARVEVRRAHTGAPNTQQYMSGAPPNIQAGPEVRTPTVGIQQHW